MSKIAMDISDLLKIALNAGASDLHLSTELPPLLCIDGAMQPTAPFAQSQVHSLIYVIMNDKHGSKSYSTDWAGNSQC